jgi:hypothetical protein
MNTITAKDDKATRFREVFAEACRNLPPPGSGCHAALLGAANYGILAGLSEADIFAELRRAVKPGNRTVSDREIWEAITKAMTDTGAAGSRISRQSYQAATPQEQNNIATAKAAADILKQDESRALALREKLIAAGGGKISPFDADIWEASDPHPGSGYEQFTAPAADMLLFLREVYQPDDYLYVGDGYEKPGRIQADHVKTVSEWIAFFQAALNKGHNLFMPFFCVNPLTGQPDEKGSFRKDCQVKSFKYCVLESDVLPLEQQIPLIRGLGLPVISLVFSGSKSIHALLDVTQHAGRQITSKADWDRIIKDELFTQLAPLGFDPATKNPSRLTRLPGVYRPEKDRWQMLLFVNREGGGYNA